MDNQFEIKGIDYVEFYVGNAIQSSLFYQYFWGFDLIAYSGPETGNKEMTSYVLRQGEITIVVTTSLNPASFIAKHIALHGDSVRKIAFEVTEVEIIFERAVAAGARTEQHPVKTEDENGYIIESSVAVYGDTLHSFLDRNNYKGLFKPGYIPYSNTILHVQTGLSSIDHITANIEAGTMDKWIRFYQDAFGFRVMVQFDENDIFTEYSAMSSKVVISQNGKIKLPLTEPINRIKKSQIQEFIDYNKGPGIQHLAFTTSNMIEEVRGLRKRGINFLNIPEQYYNQLAERVKGFGENPEELKELMIMIDEEDGGFLLQAFTKPVLDRPTYFIELIERKGSFSFGKGNVVALFTALASEQQKRQNN